MPLPYCVYVLFSLRDHLLYIGFTTDLEKTIIDHNNGCIAATVEQKPLGLVCSEFFLFREDALLREAYFRTAPGQKALRQMLNATLDRLGKKRPGRKPRLHRHTHK